MRLAGWTFEALDGAARTRVTFDGSYETPVVLLEVFGGDHRLVGGVRIREKPEPGEEGLPARRPGPAARQQRVGSAAIAPSSEPP